ncbi:Glucose N-acetyltransferase 1 [Penicillium verhagenii]|uniref:Glucose N-acetyltransferase 1 n=1 Tax=Penicillium verhagenii TaxID=1562060 RepID=UPI00254534F0|nr:Glucose N-acetyltransferase 1 [Penicillium verhagenii]KAJ5937025.1 Glucose N-acetyltransferase 1 [Penicillium verhagenii]
MAIKGSGFPYRRGSNSSEKDFFDIPDESALAIVKRQLRRPRTWITVVILFFLLQWRLPEHRSSSELPHLDFNKVDWSRYAYSSYATSESYLCNCVMVFEALDRLGSRAERVMFYPQEWDLIVENESDRTSQLLLLARDKYKVQLRPILVEGIKVEPKEESHGSSKAEWDSSVVKLNSFGLLQYDRVIHLDSDMTLLQDLDELFFLPKTPIAMPRAYWLLPEINTLSSLIAVIEPSFREYTDLQEIIQPALFGQLDINTTEHRYDMEVLNERYGESAMVLPHRPYGLLSGEFRKKNHRSYLGSHEEWNPDKALAEAKFVHFSDWPLPKPWVMWPLKQLVEMQPSCNNLPGTPEESGCRDREVWKGLYDDFRRRRKVRNIAFTQIPLKDKPCLLIDLLQDICKLLSFPAPI